MTNKAKAWIVVGVVVLVAVTIATTLLVVNGGLHANQLNGTSMKVALTPILEGSDATAASTARSLISNYQDVRHDAFSWSGAYWGISIIAMVITAASGLLLKLESWDNDSAKKDTAAWLALIGSVLVSVTTFASFKEKWQASRMAAAELERLAYEMAADAHIDRVHYYAELSRIVFARQVAIIGSHEAQVVVGGKAAGATTEANTARTGKESKASGEAP